MIAPSDIAIALGLPYPGDADPQTQQWGMWITDARMLIQNRLTRLGLGDISALDQALVDYVTRETVVEAARVAKSDGAIQVDVSIDDARTSRRYLPSKVKVVLTDELWGYLFPQSAHSGAFSVRPGFVPDRPVW